MPVPAAAVERFHRLEAKADALRAAWKDLNQKLLDARDEAGRLESLLQSHARSGGQRLEVDENGAVFWRQLHRGQRVPIGGSEAWLREDTEERHPFPDPVASSKGRQIARLRAEAQRVEAECGRLSAQVRDLAQLVHACRGELERRGWNEAGEDAPLTYRDNRMVAAFGSTPIVRPGA